MLNCTITATGRSQGDIEDALREALRLVREGNLSGGDSNDTGSYRFACEGQDDYEFLEERGWEYDGEGWTKGRMTRPRSYEEALKEEAQ